MTDIGVASLFQGSELQKLDETVINCYPNISICTLECHLYSNTTGGTNGKRTAYPSEAPEFSMFFPAAPGHRDNYNCVRPSLTLCERNFETIRRNLVIFGRIVSLDI